MSNSIIEKYLKQTKNEHAYILKENKFPIREFITTGNYALNTVISGDPHCGIPSGRIITLAGPASVGKSYISLDIVKQAQYMGYNIFYYDTEGAQNYESLVDRGINPEQFVHISCDIIKKTQTDILNLLDTIVDEKVMIVIDSVGNLLSDKEYEDARQGADKRDMTKTQEFKSLFRSMAVPAAIKSVPIIAVTHTYETMDMYGKPVVHGGSGIKYNSSIIITMTKSKEIEGSNKTIIGSGVRCTSEKNRFGKENSQVRVVIDYARGITPYSGLFDIAINVGMIESPKQGWYKIPSLDKLLRKKDFGNNKEIWKILWDNGLAERIKQNYSYKSYTNIDDIDVFDDVEESENRE